MSKEKENGSPELRLFQLFHQNKKKQKEKRLASLVRDNITTTQESVSFRSHNLMVSSFFFLSGGY